MNLQLNFSCHENWNKMTPSEQGRFCDSCAKNVFDLTDKSDDEIRLLYQQNKGKMCGRIRSSQLDRPFVLTKKRKLAKFCLALFFVFGGLLFNYELQAQTMHVENRSYGGDIAPDSLLREYNTLNAEAVTSNNTEGENVQSKQQQGEKYLIKGIVTDKETKEPLSFVNVFFEYEGKQYGTTSDLEGKYQIAVPTAVDPAKTIELHFTYIGYNEVQVTDIVLEKLKNNLLVVDMDMQMQEMMLLGDIMIEDHNIINTDPEKQGETKFDQEDLKRSPY